MRTPSMNQDSSQSAPLTGSQPNLQDRNSNTKRTRSNSIRDYTNSDKEDQRSRASSSTKSDYNADINRFRAARSPINEAVHSAIDPIDPSHTAIPPELLNQITTQITANVLQQLKASQLSPPLAHAAPIASHRDSNSSTEGAPPIDRSKVYTPPSPYRASEEAAQAGQPTSPRKQTKFQPPPEPRRPPSPPFSHATLSEDSDAKEGLTARSRVEKSSATNDDGTILEKIWGVLFDERGQSTPRLSQFLRGIAVHLIEDYEPKHSLVITPDKMQKYYEQTKLQNEIYPWQVVFDDRTSSISRFFREIEVQHHLVQDRLSERPDIPGMTPMGFEAWMTLVLKAHPDQEFDRLAYTALHMPVSNPDDRKERFPKELSRRQFPKESDSSAVAKLQSTMYTHCGVRVSKSGSMSEKDSKPIHTSNRMSQSSMNAPKTAPFDNNLSQTTTRSSLPEVDVNLRRTSTVDMAVEGSPIDIIPPPPIERERKPYAAQPGGGKNYDNFSAPIVQPADSRTHPNPPPPAKLTRSASLNNGRPVDPKTRPVQSIAIHQRPTSIQSPADLPLPTRTRTTGQYYKDSPNRGDRNRSPSKSRSNEVPHKSEGEVSYGSYPIHPGEYGPSSRRSDNRYDHRPSFSAAAEPRDRDHEPRQRYHSVSASDGARYHTSKDHMSEDEHYRNNGSYPVPDQQYNGSAAYPPNSYKGRA